MSEISISREEVIKQEIKVAEESQKVVDTHIVFTDDDGDGVSVEEIYADDTEIIDAHLLHYQFCADYHKFIAEQLVNWKIKLNLTISKMMKKLVIKQ